MSNHTRTTWATVYARLSAYDDVRVLKRVLLYTPDFSPRRVAAGVREYYKSAVAVLLVLASVGTSFGSVGLSGAFLSDTESSLANVLEAQEHDFTVGVAPSDLKVTPGGQSVDVPLVVTPTPDSPTLHYRITTAYVGGVQALCDALVVSTTGTIVSPVGPLLAFNGTAFTAPTMTFTVSLPAPVPDLPPDAPCTFTIVVRSWNALVPEPTGYTDTESMQVTIVDPPAPLDDSSSESSGEQPVAQAAVAEPEPEPVQELAPEPEPVPEPEPESEPSPQPLEETPPPVVE